MTRKFNLRNMVKTVAILAVSTVMFASCEKTEDDPKSSEKAITAFAFTSPAAEGTISGTAIAVTVPAGTDVTKLAPEVEISPKATVSPQSGAVQNFTNAVEYTVTAEDGSTAVYNVTVTVAEAQRDAKLILPDGEAWLGGEGKTIKGAYIFKADGTYDYWTYVEGSEEDAAVSHGTWETFDGGNLYDDELVINHNNTGNKKYTYTVSETTFTYENAVTDLTSFTRGAIPWNK